MVLTQVPLHRLDNKQLLHQLTAVVDILPSGSSITNSSDTLGTQTVCIVGVKHRNSGNNSPVPLSPATHCARITFSFATSKPVQL